MELGELKLGRSYIVRDRKFTYYIDRVSELIYTGLFFKIEAERIITVISEVGKMHIRFSRYYTVLIDPESVEKVENDGALVEFESWFIETMRLKLGDKKSLEMVKVDDEEVIFIWSWREDRALGYITIRREDGLKIFIGTEELEIDQEPVTCDLDLEIGKMLWTLEAEK